MRLNPRQIRQIADYKVNYPYLPDMEFIGPDHIKYRVLTSFQSTTFDNDKQYLKAEYAADLSLAVKATGFSDITDSIITFDKNTRLFTITPTASKYEYWIKGIKRVKADEDNLVISNTEGRHIIYFDGDNLVDYTSGGAEPWMASEVCAVAYIYWSVNMQQALVFTDNRHGVGMDWPTKTFLHLTHGSTYVNGLGLINIQAHQDGSQDSHCQFGVEDGLIMNEDILTPIINNTPQNLRNIAQIPIFYQQGVGDWYVSTANNFPVVSFGEGSRLAYNDFNGSIFSLKEVANAKYVLISYYATNCLLHPVVGILGKAQYNNITNARKDAPIAALNIDFYPLAEFVLLGTVIFQTKSDYTNQIKARIVQVDKTGGDYIDFRQTSLHNLAGIAQSAKAHHQYLIDGEVIEWDTSKGDFAEVTLQGNRTLATPINISAGTQYTLLIKQDATGGRSLSFSNQFLFPNGISPNLTASANTIDLLQFISDGENIYFKEIINNYAIS
jgi:hypothetical protein